MGITVINAMLVSDVETLDDGYIRIRPTSMVVIPTEERDAMQKEGASKVLTALPPMQAVIWLIGGKTGEIYSVAGRLHFAHGESSHIVTYDQKKMWLINPIEVLDIEIGGQMIFAQSGLAKFELLINDESVAFLSIPIFWADEKPEP